MQRDFTYMEVREDLLERDDTDIRKGSLQSALNMRGLATGAAEARPGLLYRRTLLEADNVYEISPTTGQRFGLVIRSASLEIIDENANRVKEFDTVPWTSAGGTIWVSPFREKVILGNGKEGIWELCYNGGDWKLNNFTFEPAPGGELAQPYWAYEQNVTIRPSAETGSITVTASDPIWTPDYVGTRIRYSSKEIEITEYVSGTVVRGTVISNLPPSWRVTVNNASVFRVGEIVVGEDTDFQGLIVSIDGSNLRIVTISYFNGPWHTEVIAGPTGAATITSRERLTPLASPLWDEALISKARGYPRAAGQVAGRLALLDFEAIPDLLALSSARRIEDFRVGAADDDAIVRQVGDGAPRWLHAVNMGDLILFSDNGIYNVPARENGVVSPSTFNPVLVDDTASSEIKPVKVEDGIVFVDSSGEKVAAVLLDGNVYLKWSVKKMTIYHNHLIRSPVALCGPALGTKSPEKYLFVVNGDGTIAAVSWQESIRDEAVGFAPWVTRGDFINVSPIFGAYWAIVEREVNGETIRFLEEFSSDALVDSAILSTETSEEQYLTGNGGFITANGEDIVVIDATAKHLALETVSYYANGWDMGDFEVAADGSVDPGVSLPGNFQIGFNFEAEMGVWPVEAIESPRIGTLTARVMQAIVSVQNTVSYEVSCNGNTRKIGPYSIGDDFDQPPEPRTEVRKFAVYGNRDHPEIVVAKRRPGPFRVLAIGQRVQA